MFPAILARLKASLALAKKTMMEIVPGKWSIVRTP